MATKEKIREAKKEDLEQLLSLLFQLSPGADDSIGSEEVLQKIFEKMIEDENYHLCVYEFDGRIIGTAILLIQLNLSHQGRPYGHIENVVTDKDCRGKGIGKKMIDYLTGKARERNCYKVILNCAKHNILFYQKCGFKETGEVEMRIDL